MSIFFNNTFDIWVQVVTLLKTIMFLLLTLFVLPMRDCCRGISKTPLIVLSRLSCLNPLSLKQDLYFFDLMLHSLSVEQILHNLKATLFPILKKKINGEKNWLATISDYQLAYWKL